MIFIKTGIYILIISAFVCSASAFAENGKDTIEEISVQCAFNGDVPAEVKDKLVVTLEKTLITLLVEKNGQPVESYMRSKDEIQANIMEGLNIVFRPKGYQIESLQFEFGRMTKADFVLRNYGPSVQSVEFELNTGNFHSFWVDSLATMLDSSVPELKQKYEPLLIGLPVNAEHSDWAYNLVRDQVEDPSSLNRIFQGMESSVSVTVQENTILRINLQPSGQLVRTLRVRPYSRSMFQLALDPLKELVTSNSNIVVGMPVSWLTENRQSIEKEFCRILSEDVISRKFQLESTCRLYFIERDPDAAYLEFRMESRMWNFRAEAMIDVGNDENPAEFEGHLGMKFADTFEGFILLNFFPDDIRFRPDIGVGIRPFKDTFAGAGWDISDSVGKLYFTQYLSPYMRLEAEIFEEDEGQNQFGLVYKPYQFVAFGVFSDGDDDYWLRASFAF